MIGDNQAFAGSFDNLVIVIWAIEIVINPYRFAERGQVELNAHMFANFCFRTPKAFGVVS